MDTDVLFDSGVRSGGTRVPFDPLHALDAMMVSRECDRREGILARQGKAPFHVSSTGHEPLAALAQVIREGDLVFSHYRDKALMLALGMPLHDLARLFLGKADEHGNGRQMPGHFGHRGRGIWSALSPVAHNLLPACGAAWGMKRRGLANVAMALVGDGSCRQGEFFEAVAFAVERRLPVLFVVEDNHLGISTPTDKLNPLALGLLDGMPLTKVDARDPANLFAAAQAIVDGIRQDGGPAILWCDLDRLDGHTSFDDQRNYLPEEAIRAKWQQDPVARTIDRLIGENRLSEPEVTSRRDNITSRVSAAYEEVFSEPAPNALAALADRLAPLPDKTPPFPPGRPEGTRWTMVEAVRNTLDGIFHQDDRCLLFGEDVEDPKGGVFGLTKGLSTRFPDRVHNAPLAEATIAGVGAGLASVGLRPFLELQFVDFAGPAMSQIANNLATLRWRSAGDWTCPAVIYAAYGGYVSGAGIWHSQSLEAAFCQIPGLRVVVAGTAADAAGLFWTAAQANDPTVILLPKRLFHVAEPVARDLMAVPFGKAARLREGADVTVVCWGNTVRVAQEAARQLGPRVSLDLFDLRSLVPWDRTTILGSVRKTGRLLVVQEDNLTCSVGQTILGEVSADRASWSNLKCAPRLLGRPDVHIGFNASFAELYLPQPSAVADAILDMTGASR